MHYEEILAHMAAALRQRPPVRCVVAAPYDDAIIGAINEACDLGYLGEVVLIGDIGRINGARESFQLIDAAMPEAIAGLAVEAAAAGDHSMIVKGSISSSTLLKSVLKGGAPGAVASHVYIINSKSFPGKAILVSDAGVNISPDLRGKARIIDNCVQVAKSVGIAAPRVALLSAVEMINTAMPSTLDAAALKVMGERGVFGAAIVDGPMALDAAMLPRAAKAKGLGGAVAGDADILILDSIEAGNSTAKALIGADGDAMGVIVGASRILAFPSRGDSPRTRQHSLLLAAFLTSSVSV